MEVQTIPQNWTIKDGQLATENGTPFSTKNLKDICVYHKIPATLLSIDDRYGTNTFHDVAKAAVKEVTYRESPSGMVIMDPLSRYVEDDEFMPLVDMVNVATKLDPKVTDAGLSKRVEWALPLAETDDFLGDVISRKIIIERLPQGGVNYSTGLLRKVCSNGMTVADREYTKLSRRNLFGEDQVKELIAQTYSMSVSEYFKNLFMLNGEYVSASVSDIRAMKNCLGKMLTQEIAAGYFPLDLIKEVYKEQGIDIEKTPSKQLDRMPSGFSYYEAFNILTHGMKEAEQTLENHIEVAKFARPSKMQVLKALSAQFSTIPVFTETQKKRLMGDL